MINQFEYARTDLESPISQDLWLPSYSDHRFDGILQTVFIDSKVIPLLETIGSIRVVPNTSYRYSDHLIEEFGHDEYFEAWRQSENSNLPLYSAGRAEEMLRILLGDPKLRLVHLMTGVNPSLLNSYKLFGFIQSPS